MKISLPRPSLQYCTPNKTDIKQIWKTKQDLNTSIFMANEQQPFSDSHIIKTLTQSKLIDIAIK